MKADERLGAAFRELLAPQDDAVARHLRSACTATLFGHREAFEIDRFVVVERLGAGAMGTVFRAHDPQLGRDVAIKLMRHQGAASNQRILAEAQTLARLNHPNIVAIYDSGWHEGVPFIVMELVRGTTLERWMKAPSRAAGGSARWKEVRPHFLAAAQALAQAHDAGIVHCDFKPANVLLGEDGRVRVADFGIARSAAPDPEETTEEDVRRPGTGTPGYMAPEQFRRASPDPRMDQYAFCVSLYRALTGKLPFAVPAAGGQPQEPPTMPPKVPASVWRVLRRGLAQDPSDRYPSMQALIAALEQTGRRSRMLGAWGGSLFAASAAAAVLASEGDPCEPLRMSTLELWSETKSTAIRDAVTRSGHRDPSAVFERVAPAIDAYVAELAQGRVQACEATWVRREQSGVLLDRRMRCFDRRQVALEASLASLREASAQSLDLASDLIAALPSLHRCSDVEALQMQRKFVASPEVNELSRRIEAVRAHSDLGHSLKDRQPEVEAMLEEARELGDDRLLIDALLLAGHTHLEARLFEQAHALLEEAFWLADKTRFDEAGGHAAVGLARVATEQPGQLGQATLWTDHARAAYLRAGFPDGLTPALARAKSRIEAELGRIDAAVEWALESIDLAPSPLTRVKARLQLARVYEAAASFDEAQREYRAAIDEALEEFGPDHDSVGTLRFEFARMLTLSERYDAAMDELKEAARIFERVQAHGYKLLAVQSSIASLLQDRGLFEDALPYAREVADGFRRLYGSEHPHTVAASVNLGVMLFDLGQFAESETICRTAAAAHDAAAIDRVPSWRAIACETAAMLEQGRGSEARRLLQDTLQNPHLDPDGEESAILRFRLAQAIHATCGDPRRVAKLIGEAAEIYRRGLATPDGEPTVPESWLESASVPAGCR